MSGTTNIIHIYLQNVWKNYMLVDSLLEFQKGLYDILFIQESSWNFIRFASSITSPNGQEVVGTPIHSGLGQFNFHRTLSRHLELCVLFILDCPDFTLLLEEIQLTTETSNFCLSLIEADASFFINIYSKGPSSIVVSITEDLVRALE